MDEEMIYDVIGDVHGMRRPLEKLLKKLGYTNRDGIYCSTERRAIFVGDIIDRGPEIPASCDIVQGMMEAGAGAGVVMANHEANLLAMHVRHPICDGEYCRRRSNRNIAQVHETLAQFGNKLDDALMWFSSWPLWLNVEDMMVFHACWRGQAELQQAKITKLNDTNFKRIFSNNKLLSSYNNLLKGPEFALGRGRQKDGYDVRYLWFAREQIDDAVVRTGVDDYGAHIRKNGQRLKEFHHRKNGKLMFFGHYSMHGAPRIFQRNAICVDFSNRKKGCLAAYSHQPGKATSQKQFTAVPLD